MRQVDIVARRKKLGLSMEDVAQVVGVTIQTVASWETGARRPQPRHRQRLADVLGCWPQSLTCCKKEVL